MEECEIGGKAAVGGAGAGAGAGGEVGNPTAKYGNCNEENVLCHLLMYKTIYTIQERGRVVFRG